MRLEPVYLLAPEEPERPRTPSRRQWLLAVAAAGLAGLGSGFIFGRSSRTRTQPNTPEDPPRDEHRELLDWAIGLASAGPEELLRHTPALLMVAEQTRDAALLPTLERLADVLLAGEGHDSRGLADSLAHTLEVFPESAVAMTLRDRLTRRR
ncbi:MAG: hypothetical protein AB7I19_19485 [Planctomycetota bacterium]